MIVHTYDHETGVFVESIEADKCQLTGVWLRPACSTEKKPPAAQKRKVRVFRDEKWSLVADHIGVSYWLADGSEHIMDSPGDLPDDALLQPPELRSEDEILADALIQLNDVHAALLRSLTDYATREEADTWPVKETAARALIADTASLEQISMLTAEAHGTGDTAMDLAQEIVARADSISAHIGSAGAIRRRHRADMQTAHAAAPGAGQLAQDLDQILALAQADSAALLAST